MSKDFAVKKRKSEKVMRTQLEKFKKLRLKKLYNFDEFN